jgi:glutamine synthetase
LYGQWQHFSVPVDYYDEDDLFKTGLGFDGSSIRGFKSIESSDMLLVCDPTTAFIDPICAHPTLSVIANVYEPGTLEAFARDPRNVARRAEAYMKENGYADTMYCGPEAEFFIFDQVKYETGRYSRLCRGQQRSVVEHRRVGAWPQDRLQGRLLPGGAVSTCSRTSARRWSTPWSRPA